MIVIVVRCSHRSGKTAFISDGLAVVVWGRVSYNTAAAILAESATATKKRNGQRMKKNSVQTATNKDSELLELRKTIEALQQQSAEAGLTKAALQSMQAVQRTLHGTSSAVTASAHGDKEKKSGMMLPRQLSNDSMSSVNSANSQGSQQYQHSQISGSGASSVGSLKEKELQEQNGADKKAKKKKGSGWLRSSFGKAFSRGSGSGGKGEDGNGSDSSVPNSPQVSRSCPLPPAPIQEMAEGDETDDSPQVSMGTQQQGTNQQQPSQATQEMIDELRKQLRDKDMVLTDIRLEALSSAHQLDQMKELVTKLKNEIGQLKAENERLSRLVGGGGVGCGQNNAPSGGQNSENSSACSIPSLLKAHSLESIEKRLSSSDQSGSPTVDMYLNDNIQESRDSKRIPISVHLTITGDVDKLQRAGADDEIFIGCVAVSNKTSWPLLDAIVRKAFKEYVLKIDPASNLGLSAESVQCYHIGDLVRTKDANPELLPCGYLVGNDMQIKIVVKGTAQQASLDALAFETLIPKAVLARYISLLTEHRRIILCGPSGTGKTFLAHKLAEFLAKKDNSERGEDAIATFSVDRNSQTDLKGYLAHMAEQCSNGTADSELAETPQVLIVDNLHHVASLSDVFNELLLTNSENCPYIIGTINQARCSTTNLQLSHNFRWVLCANHIEPVKGLLARCLRRRLVDHEARTGLRSSPELQQIIEWMPQVWMHVNKFLETHNSADATIGPRLFLSCPVDVLSAQVWFTDLWNFTLAPYLIEAAREGLQLYGQRPACPWDDPVEWLKQSYPFEHTRASQELTAVREEDITSGESTTLSNRDSDPLLNMLMRLQEAASYTPQTSISEATADCS
ncbi:neuron navigator 2-like [Tropilaelaps mercedesae]|uniref:Neuron navigator 2-like n=1 Tax=Tropilaelaps mercedesae TaxID=418985 RepID=A0A1V9XTV9_9ACAR|nr:neuron navigator 2-like [Tropilaelaps mercedesae]